MLRSLTTLWVALASAIVALIVLAQFWIQQRAHSTTQRIAEVLALQLSPIERRIASLIDGYAGELSKVSATTDLALPLACAELKRNPLVHALVVIDRVQRARVYPSESPNLTSDERAILDDLQLVLRDRRPGSPALATKDNSSLPIDEAAGASVQVNRYNAAPQTASSQTASSQTVSGQTASGQEGTSQALANAMATTVATPQWLTWYHRRGLMLAYTWEVEQRWQAAIVLPRARWLADLVGMLADLAPTESLAGDAGASLRQLIDVEGKVIHQWGALPQSDWPQFAQAKPDAQVALAAPLDGWQVREFITPSLRHKLSGDQLQLPIWLAVAGVSVALLLGGTMVTININRQVRLATQRVSFVNQVSHELRTPLTNICMYADLIAKSLPADEGSEEQNCYLERVGVIRSESQRLARLVNNVLAFARPQPTPTRRHPEVLDQIVRETLAAFEPKLKELGFRIELDLQVTQRHELDRGSLEQILVNLISNVEKYAQDGRLLRIATRADGNRLSIDVSDHGPGIPARWQQRIFEPFVRLTDRLVDPTGTGIGLSIARDLARRHGGDCQLVPTAQGAMFRCELLATAVGNSLD